MRASTRVFTNAGKVLDAGRIGYLADKAEDDCNDDYIRNLCRIAVREEAHYIVGVVGLDLIRCSRNGIKRVFPSRFVAEPRIPNGFCCRRPFWRCLTKRVLGLRRLARKCPFDCHVRAVARTSF